MNTPWKWLESTEHILFDVKDGIARITLNRPEKRNAVTALMLKELKQAFVEADDLLEVNVIVLQGAGRDFCAGYDLASVYAGRAAEAGQTSRYRSSVKTFDDDCWGLERNQEAVNVIPAIHKPVIGKVHGNCLAGATDFALACDMVIASEDARIGFPATRANGSPPSHMWTYHLGPQWAKRLLMSGDCLTGRDAARLGLVMDAFPADQLDAEVNELARRLACVDSELLSAHKRIVNLALELTGAGTLQRLAAENDARAHLSTGPRRTAFKADMAAHGLKHALTQRDAPFGDGLVRLGAAGERNT
ncbi:MAG TPA: crotonase/enoyl-CoA hydratase family protein [Burkholderiaceae bacterium]|nr:crotonase/enoyl-CoA hydratase family protein [Burkholderiaceae bacterium]